MKHLPFIHIFHSKPSIKSRQPLSVCAAKRANSFIHMKNQALQTFVNDLGLLNSPVPFITDDEIPVEDSLTSKIEIEDPHEKMTDP